MIFISGEVLMQLTVVTFISIHRFFIQLSPRSSPSSSSSLSTESSNQILLFISILQIFSILSTFFLSLIFSQRSRAIFIGSEIEWKILNILRRSCLLSKINFLENPKNSQNLRVSPANVSPAIFSWRNYVLQRKSYHQTSRTHCSYSCHQYYYLHYNLNLHFKYLQRTIKTSKIWETENLKITPRDHTSFFFHFNIL